jgi:putative PIN family toxin of toxin-antitoxin system
LAAPARHPSAGVFLLGFFMLHAVIDTNIWLDLYVFEDESVNCLKHALETGQIRARRTTGIDAELHDVLGRTHIARHISPSNLAASLLRWESISDGVVADTGCRAPWICPARDDQKFLDLCHQTQANLLLTKDKALLTLARRARQSGLFILKAQDLAAFMSALPTAPSDVQTVGLLE